MTPQTRAMMVETVRRDRAVLDEEPIYHVPSRSFYEQRITDFTAALKEEQHDDIEEL